jgi:RNA polymerase sigma-70 factor (ECF subfamily)
MYELPETRDSLLLRLRQPGNHDAWRDFASLYEPLIYRLAARKGMQHADAQDLIQDVLLAVSRNIDRLEVGSEAGRFRGWLFRIVRNMIVNAVEKKRRTVLGSGDSDVLRQLAEEPDLSPAERTVYLLEFRGELLHWAAKKIQPEFQPANWELFWCTSVAGEPIPAAAQRLGLSLGAAYAARCRILARLKQIIEEFDDWTQW